VFFQVTIENQSIFHIKSTWWKDSNEKDDDLTVIKNEVCLCRELSTNIHTLIMRIIIREKSIPVTILNMCISYTVMAQ